MSRLTNLAASFSLVLVSLAGADDLPPAANHDVDFHKEVVPILYRSCTKCHTGDKPKGGLRMETRELLLRGGESGAVVEPGKSDESILVELVAGVDPDRVMPAQGPRLKAEQIGILRAWIDQGMKWEKGFRFGSSQQASLAPREVELPPAEAAGGLAHPVDRLLAPYFKEHEFTPDEVVSDRLFARRVYLDLVGLLPPPEVIDALEKDTRDDKRARLVDELLASNEALAIHWLTFWNDALRNAYRGTGYIDGGRQQITPWLYRSLHENKPYDQFVHELISPVAGSEGFVKGIVWRGVVNASQRPQMQAAQNISQVFLGTNLKCASCHDSFINDWKLTDSYALAAVFADGPLEIHRCNKPTGESAKVGFIYPQLGQIDAGAAKAQRMKQLADLVTSKQNGRLSRTIVNRLWAQLFGRGIVENVDDMDQPPFSADLLDWLAADFAAQSCDVKHTLRLLCTSRAYQLPAVGAPRPDDADFVFQGPIVRRMTAEQFVDAVSTLTGDWPNKPDVNLPAIPSANANQNQSSKLPTPPAAHWIWNDAGAAKAAAGGRVFFRKEFALDEAPQLARAAITCDNAFTLWVNGQRVAASEAWEKPATVDIAKHLQRGRNVIAVEACNFPSKETGQGLQFGSPNPAGLIFAAHIKSADEKRATIASDKSWKWSKEVHADWEKRDFDDGDWKPAFEIAAAAGGPWGGRIDLTASLQAKSTSTATDGSSIGVRAALLNDDALTRALGRTNREQVVTRRDTLATTLQAIEQTNGTILDAKLSAGARNWHARGFTTQDELVTAIYRRALGRAPTGEELTLAQELLGEETSPAGIADLLWVVVMLPEFQLIH